jgi:hypothetical protein
MQEASYSSPAPLEKRFRFPVPPCWCIYVSGKKFCRRISNLHARGCYRSTAGNTHVVSCFCHEYVLHWDAGFCVRTKLAAAGRCGDASDLPVCCDHGKIKLRCMCEIITQWSLRENMFHPWPTLLAPLEQQSEEWVIDHKWNCGWLAILHLVLSCFRLENLHVIWQLPWVFCFVGPKHVDSTCQKYC